MPKQQTGQRTEGVVEVGEDAQTQEAMAPKIKRSVGRWMLVRRACLHSRRLGWSRV
jgi:hypothetical protein